jgi:hypothetical protein
VKPRERLGDVCAGLRTRRKRGEQVRRAEAIAYLLSGAGLVAQQMIEAVPGEEWLGLCRDVDRLAPFAGLQVDGCQIDQRDAVGGVDLDDLAKRGLGLAKLAGLHERKRAHVLHESRLRRQDYSVALRLERQQFGPELLLRERAR